MLAFVKRGSIVILYLKTAFFLGHLLQVLTTGSMPRTFKTNLHKRSSARLFTQRDQFSFETYPLRIVGTDVILCSHSFVIAPVVFYFPYTLFLYKNAVFRFQAEYFYFISRF